MQNLIDIDAYDSGLNLKSSPITIEKVYPETITLNDTSLDMILGKEAQLTATLTPDNVTEKNLQWSSDNENVATVDENGLVKAVDKGSATITVTADAEGDALGKTATCSVTVSDVPEDIGIVINQDKVSVTEGDDFELEAYIAPSYSDAAITWSISDNSIVTLSAADGNKAAFSTVKVGLANVTASIEVDGKTYSAECNINVGSMYADGFVINDDGVLTAYNGSRMNIVIPANVTAIDDYVFEGMTFISTVTIPDSVKKIGKEAFAYLENLKSVTFEGAGLEVIGEKAFFTDIKLGGDIVLPDSLKEIGPYAFSTTIISGINIPSGITRLPEGVFMQCTDLNRVDLPDNMTVLGKSSLANTPALQNLRLPSGLTTIEENALVSSGITSFAAPSSLRSIGAGALAYLKSCTTVELNEGLETVGASAFAGSAMETLSIPDSVTEVGADVVYACPNLITFRIGKNVPVLVRPIVSAAALKNIEIADGNTSMYTDENGLFTYDKTVLIGYPLGRIDSTDFTYTVPDSVIRIEEFAFYGGSGLAHLNIGAATQTIGSYAFRDTGITSLTDTKNLEYIEKEAFAGTKLAKIEFGSNMKKIGDYVFAYNPYLTDVDLGGTEELCNYVFVDCNAILDFTFPDTVTKLGQGVLLNCRGLKHAYIGKNITTLDSSTFTQDNMLEAIDVSPENTKYYGEDGVLYERRENNTISLLKYVPAKVDETFIAPDNLIWAEINTSNMLFSQRA